MILFSLMLLLLIGLSTISANNLSGDDTTSKLSMDESNLFDVDEAVLDDSSDKKVVDSLDTLMEDTGTTYNKDSKNKKTSSVKTFEVTNTDSFTDTFNQISILEDYDECIVNIRSTVRITDELGAFYHMDDISITKLTINGFNNSVNTELTGGYLETMTIFVGQGQTLIINDLQGNAISIDNNGNCSLNNFVLNNGRDGVIDNQKDANMTITNSDIRQIHSYGNLIINNTSFASTGSCLTVISGHCTLSNANLYNADISVWENASLTIDDNITLRSGYSYIIGNVNNLTPFIPNLYEIGGNRTLENITFGGGVANNLEISGNIRFKNCILNRTLKLNNNSKIIIDDDCIIGDDIIFYWDNKNTVEVEISDISRIINYLLAFTGTNHYQNLNVNRTKNIYGNITLENCNITSSIFNYANLTLKDCFINGSINNYHEIKIINCTIRDYLSNSDNASSYISDSNISNTISNSGNLTIDEKTIFSNDFELNINGNGIIYTENITRLLPFINYYNDNYTLENLNINKTKTNNKTLTLKNCTINSTIYNYGTLIINDDCTITPNAYIRGNGTITINDTNNILPYLESINNNWTITNFNFAKSIRNTANIVLNNCTISTEIQNSGNITINDNCVINSNTVINGNGNIIYDDPLVLLDIGDKLNGTYTLEDYIFTKSVIFDGNITLKYCDILSKVVNYGNLTLTDCLLDKSQGSDKINELKNYGTLSINDNTDIVNISITGNGSIVIKNIKKVLPFISLLTGNHSINKYTFNNPLTITDTIKISNSTINTTITNNGILIIDDNSNFTPNAVISGNGSIIINDSSRLINYIELYNDDNTLINTNITTNKTNNANLVLINCNIKAHITNNANITLINCSLSNNNMTVNSFNTNGFLLNNLANATIIECIISNNTFNSLSDRDVNFYGAIVNNGEMTISNSTFYNNIVGNTITYGTIGEGSCIYNNGLLTIDTSTFEDNHAFKNAGAVYTNGKVIVNNTKFLNNTASRGGGAITVMNNETIIDNCQFIENKVIPQVNLVRYEGGAILIGNHSTTNDVHNPYCMINNTLFKSNTVYTYITTSNGVKTNINTTSGNAIKRNYGQLLINNTEFINQEGTCGVIYSGNSYISEETPKTNIYNSIFRNCSGTIIQDYCLSYSNIINNTFKNSYATSIFKNNEFINSKYIHPTSYIANNTFLNNNGKNDTIITTRYRSNGFQQFNPFVSIENNTYINTNIIDNLQLDIPDDITENIPVTITGTYNINNSRYYDENLNDTSQFDIYINGEYNKTVNNLSFTVTPTENMQITINPSISNSSFKTRILKNNESGSTNEIITITPLNYDELITDGEIIGLTEDTKIIFEGDFIDKELYFTTNHLIINGENASFTDSTFILDASNIIIENMKINNHETDYPIKNLKDNNILRNNNITIINTYLETAAIYNRASNTHIYNNTIYADGLAKTIDFSTGSGISYTQAILLIGGNNNTVEYNNLRVTTTQENEQYGTIEAITNSIDVTNTLIQYNNINVTGGKFSYGIDSLSNVRNVTVQYNNIHVESYRYTDGIQVGNGAEHILLKENNITCICQNTTPVDEEAITYGIVTSNMGSGISKNITITKNNINITGSVNYGIEVYQTTNTDINNNNITVNGLQSMGIGYAHSPNSIVTNNTINTIGDSTVSLTIVTEEIQQANTGIQIQQDSDNILIEDNVIKTSDVGKQDQTINVDSINVTIKNNQLQSSTKSADEAVITNRQDTIIFNNTEVVEVIEEEKIQTVINVNDTLGLINNPTTITARIHDTNTNEISDGLVTFMTSNGEILMTTTIEDGVASITLSFIDELNDTITAIYTPIRDNIESSMTTFQLTIQKAITRIVIEDVTITAGQNVTLTARITDQLGNNFNGGKVTFKVNGKTLKDANGKTIYAKVVNGVATATYEVPMDASGKDLNITAVYSGSTKYDKQTTTTTVTVIEATPTLTITPFNEPVTTGSTVTLKAKVALGDTPITTGKIVFKINGKTVKDANGKVIYAKVDVNGEVSVDYNLGDLKANTYTVEAVFTASGYDKLTSNTTMTVVKA